MKKRVLVIHGPNINLTGEREKGIYGSDSFETINREIADCAESLGFDCEIFQSNHEGAIIDKIHEARLDCDGIVINPGAYTHYSYAIRDCIKAVNIPTIEVHLSDIKNREAFRKKSVIKDVVMAQIYGKGIRSYFDAIELCLKKK